MRYSFYSLVLYVLWTVVLADLFAIILPVVGPYLDPVLDEVGAFWSSHGVAHVEPVLASLVQYLEPRLIRLQLAATPYLEIFWFDPRFQAAAALFQTIPTPTDTRAWLHGVAFPAAQDTLLVAHAAIIRALSLCSETAGHLHTTYTPSFLAALDTAAAYILQLSEFAKTKAEELREVMAPYISMAWAYLEKHVANLFASAEPIWLEYEPLVASVLKSTREVIVSAQREAAARIGELLK